MALILFLFTFITVSADTYYVSMNASLSKVVYGTNENITLSGTLNRGTIVSSNLSNHTTLANANITLNLSYYNGTIISAYILNTSTDGKFSTKSEANPNSTALFAPNTTGSYLIILDYKDPTKVLYRSTQPIISPTHWYENEGFKSGVVYPCGAVIINDTLHIYYGGADTYVCLATAPLNPFLNSLKLDKPSKMRRFFIN